MSIRPAAKQPGFTPSQIMQQWKGVITKKCARVTQKMARQSDYVRINRGKTGSKERKAKRALEETPPMSILKAGFTNERIKMANKMNRTTCDECWGKELGSTKFI